MIHYYKIGQVLTYISVVSDLDIAKFEAGIVHNVYSTFALARDAEWACRQFVLKMKEENEEGIGTFVKVIHVSPALVQSEVVFSATLKEINGHEVICSFEARVKNRLVAEGEIGQKIIVKKKLEQLFEGLKDV